MCPPSRHHCLAAGRQQVPHLASVAPALLLGLRLPSTLPPRCPAREGGTSLLLLMGLSLTLWVGSPFLALMRVLALCWASSLPAGKRRATLPVEASLHGISMAPSLGRSQLPISPLCHHCGEVWGCLTAGWPLLVELGWDAGVCAFAGAQQPLHTT